MIDIKLKVGEPILEAGTTYLVRYECSLDDFATTELSEDSALLTHLFQLDIAVGVVYYVRARYILIPGGLQAWSPVLMGSGRNYYELASHISPPTLVKPPEISSPLGNFDLPQVGLKFTVSHTRVHKSFMWVLTDTKGTLHYAVQTRSSEFIVPGSLFPNHGYIIRCAIVIDNDTTSQFGSLLFTTAGASRVVEQELINQPVYNNDGTLTEVTLGNPVTNPEPVTYEIIVNNEVITTQTVPSGTTLDTSTYGPPFIIRVKGSDGRWEYIYINADGTSCVFPANLPYVYQCLGLPQSNVLPTGLPYAISGSTNASTLPALLPIDVL